MTFVISVAPLSAMSLSATYTNDVFKVQDKEYIKTNEYLRLEQETKKYTDLNTPEARNADIAFSQYKTDSIKAQDTIRASDPEITKEALKKTLEERDQNAKNKGQSAKASKGMSTKAKVALGLGTAFTVLGIAGGALAYKKRGAIKARVDRIRGKAQTVIPSSTQIAYQAISNQPIKPSSVAAGSGYKKPSSSSAVKPLTKTSTTNQPIKSSQKTSSTTKTNPDTNPKPSVLTSRSPIISSGGKSYQNVPVSQSSVSTNKPATQRKDLVNTPTNPPNPISTRMGTAMTQKVQSGQTQAIKEKLTNGIKKSMTPTISNKDNFMKKVGNQVQTKIQSANQEVEKRLILKLSPKEQTNFALAVQNDDKVNKEYLLNRAKEIANKERLEERQRQRNEALKRMARN